MIEKENLISLVRDLQSGKPEAEAEVYELFRDDVYYFILKTVKNDHYLAEDRTRKHLLNSSARSVRWKKKTKNLFRTKRWTRMT